MTTGFAVFFGLLVVYVAVLAWLGRLSITMPIIFVIVGLFFGPNGLVSAKGAELLTEMIVALLLFLPCWSLCILPKSRCHIPRSIWISRTNRR